MANDDSAALPSSPFSMRKLTDVLLGACDVDVQDRLRAHQSDRQLAVVKNIAKDEEDWAELLLSESFQEIRDRTLPGVAATSTTIAYVHSLVRQLSVGTSKSISMSSSRYISTSSTQSGHQAVRSASEPVLPP
jgi:hypothetical protein